MSKEAGITMVVNGALVDVHSPRLCEGQPFGCWVHSPLEWALSSAPVRWREDRGFAERICQHGIGHPDLQDSLYNWDVHRRDVSVHGCDGCCYPRPQWYLDHLPSGDASDA